MHNVIQQKYKMRSWLQDHGKSAVRMNMKSGVWGPAARRNAWRVTKAATGKASTRRKNVEAVLWPNPFHIIEKTYKWNGSLDARSGKPLGTVWHNAAASHCTPDDVHRWHLANGWKGIAYHFFVDKQGKVYRGRPEWALGGHAVGASAWLGVCFEGNFDKEEMGAAQMKAGQRLAKYLHQKYNRPDKRHKDMPGNSTSCPGKNFPFTTITGHK